MTSIERIAGSFRDPAGHLIQGADGQILRVIRAGKVEEFDQVAATGLFDKLHEKGWLVSHQPADQDIVDSAVKAGELQDGDRLLAHPRLRYISYPYEWGFSQLKAAALHHLKVHLAALDAGVTLSDATAFNIQFEGGRPVFIDTLSFEIYNEGDFWLGQQQFTDQFLAPLLLWSNGQMPPNALYRGRFKGVPTDLVARLTPWWRKISLRYLNYISLPARLERRYDRTAPGQQKAIKGKLPKTGFEFILKQLVAWIEALPAPDVVSVWRDYEATRTYSDAEVSAKSQVVREWVGKWQPGLVYDLGCNAAEFSRLSIEAGADYVVGFEQDFGALEGALAANEAAAEKNVLVLQQDLLNPSPDLGWNQAERMGLRGRANPDCVLALALIHHLAISGNVPLAQVIDYLFDLAPRLIVEWVPKDDPMVKQLLLNRKDVFSDYAEETVRGCLERRGRIVGSEKVSATGRTLFIAERD